MTLLTQKKDYKYMKKMDIDHVHILYRVKKKSCMIQTEKEVRLQPLVQADLTMMSVSRLILLYKNRNVHAVRILDGFGKKFIT